MDITTIPLAELQADLNMFLLELNAWENLYSVYGGAHLREDIEEHRQIIQVIREELARRNV